VLFGLGAIGVTLVSTLRRTRAPHAVPPPAPPEPLGASPTPA
jgi:hypothetical protein